MKNIIITLTALCLFSCNNNKQIQSKTPTIDSTLEVNVSKTLKDKLIEINALSGQVIVMDTKTGEIKAMVRLERTDSGHYKSCKNFGKSQESGSLCKIPSLMAALESGKVKCTDTFDTGNGAYLMHDEVMKDHNWKRGGYGQLSALEGIMVSSNIATAKEIQKAYGHNPKGYFAQLNKMSYGEPKVIEGIDGLKPASFTAPEKSGWNDASLAWFSIGYYQKIAPIQILTFYNAIANNGKMVKPQLYKGSIVVINPQIASKETIKNVRQALERTVSEGLGKPANSNKVKVAGKTGTAQILSKKKDNAETEENIEYIVNFCGYFPADNPQYSAIVVINKKGLPASGGLMAGDSFRKIVEMMINKGYFYL
nr:penicillin-binding transpeptidase domain-containing protein [uncultured Bacteroides sp.]